MVAYDFGKRSGNEYTDEGNRVDKLASKALTTEHTLTCHVCFNA